MLVEIPIIPNPNRQINIILNNQECTILLYQKDRQMYLDLFVGQIAICQGAICLDMVPIIQVAQNNFVGKLLFVDTLGSSAPSFEGLNSRYFLIYYTADENLSNIIQTDLGG